VGGREGGIEVGKFLNYLSVGVPVLKINKKLPCRTFKELILRDFRAIHIFFTACLFVLILVRQLIFSISLR
jgi:hypothetical protein